MKKGLQASLSWEVPGAIQYRGAKLVIDRANCGRRIYAESDVIGSCGSLRR